MARILITGSSDGIGAVAARTLIKQGHSVILHARNESRAKDAQKACPGAEACLVADLSDIAAIKKFAADSNSKYGSLDAVVHNAGIGYNIPASRIQEGFSTMFVVNSLAPYILTTLMNKPKRLIYLSSGLHSSGDDSLKDITWQSRSKIEPFQGYSDTKLQNTIFAAAVARFWADIQSVSLDPGWVPTKLGGSGAPQDIGMSGDSIAWLATVGGETGKHYGPNQKTKKAHSAVGQVAKQDELLVQYEELSGIRFPR